MNHKKKPIKYRYTDENGYQLFAGGIIPYDQSGMWLIGENILFNDIGGKYNYLDGDIFQTISREFNEELYHSVELTRSQVIELYAKTRKLYITDHQNRPIYLSLPIHTSVLEKLGINLSSDKFDQCRKIVIRSNPAVPDNLYKSTELRYFTYFEIERMLAKDQIDGRLRVLLKLFRCKFEN